MYEKIVYLIKKSGITFYKLSKETNISAGNFSDWKSGRRTPSFKALQKIAEYFKIPVSYFYETDNENKEIKSTIASELDAEKGDELIEKVSELMKGLSDEDKRQVLNYVKFISQQKK